MKKMIATRDLTTGEQQQFVKQAAKSRYYNRKLDKQRGDGEQRLRPIVKREDQIEDDELAGLDLRRVRYIRDLGIDS